MQTTQTYEAIPAEKFQFAQADKKLGDKKLQTKPVSFMRDAWRRFAKNRSSIVGMVIIAVLILFTIIAPIVSNYDVAYNEGYYRNVLPKISPNADGVWDGTKKYESNRATYQYNYAIGIESGRLAVIRGAALPAGGQGQGHHRRQGQTEQLFPSEFHH